MRFVSGSAQHIGTRSSQQDAFGFTDPGDEALVGHGGFVAVVCDGMGGLERGELASRTAVRAFLDAYSRKLPVESIPDALERSTREANQEVASMAEALGLLGNLGTTLVGAAVHETSLYFVSVGDSGLFHVNGGQAKMINRHHVYANYLNLAVARGEITEEVASAHPDRESLTSYIGAEFLAEIDRNVEPWPFDAGDAILLASDGMFKTLAPLEIQACLHGPTQTWPKALVKKTLAKKRSQQDNVTVVAVGVEREARAAGGSKEARARWRRPVAAMWGRRSCRLPFFTQPGRQATKSPAPRMR